MKKTLLLIFTATILILYSCSEDLGNYDYITIEQPVVSNIDSVYNVNIGDRLVIEPVIEFNNQENLSFEWKIDIPDELRSANFEGLKLDMFFGLKPQSYKARFTVTDNGNGMKYFTYFTISGQTDFSQGITLLTSNNGKSELSFIKPDGTIRTNIYEQMHGEPLPDGPLQLITLRHEHMMGQPYLGYWIICSDGQNPGVQIDVNTFQQIKTLKENFFNKQEGEIHAQHLFPMAPGVMAGIINNKLYIGASSTYYISPIYGFFGTPVLGNYQLAPFVLYSGAYYLGYDYSNNSIAYFDGGANYYGDDYQTEGSAFDPKNIDLDVINMQMLNMDAHYIFGKDNDGQIYELKFGIKPDPRTVTPMYMKVFAGQNYITENTKWVLSNTEVFYFTSNDKIYRYNPLNEEIKALETNFEGKDVTMLKMADDGITLIAGTNGSIFYLDVSTGKYGDIINRIDGISGTPIDLYIKE